MSLKDDLETAQTSKPAMTGVDSSDSPVEGLEYGTDYTEDQIFLDATPKPLLQPQRPGRDIQQQDRRAAELFSTVAKKLRGKTHLKIFSAFKYRDRKDTVLITVAVIAAMVQGCLPALNMTVMGLVVNAVGNSVDMSKFVNIIIAFAILAITGLVSGSLNAGCMEAASERQAIKLKKLYLKAIARQEIAYFDTLDTSTLATEIEGACVHVRDGTGLKFGIIFQSIAQFVAGYVIAIIRGWQMALVMTSIIPIIGGTVTAMMYFLRGAMRESEEKYEKAGSVAEESLAAVRTVVAFGSEERLSAMYSERLEDSLNSDIKGATYKATGFGVMYGALMLSYALGWWYGGSMVADSVGSGGDSDDTAGRVLTVFFCIMIASFAMSQLMPNISALIAAANAIVPIHRLIERESSIDPFSEEGLHREIQGSIEFRNVSFAYPTRPNKNIYNGLSFTIQPGETVAFVGPSGSGKSTIVQLLERFYNLSAGDILIDGARIQDYNVRHLRSQMSLVSQEPRLLSTTVRKNIEYGKIGCTDEEIADAAKKANAFSYISTFPDGFNTVVGEGGSLLSGGQKQRIAIARAILRDPKILILDEATSALDNESERQIQQSLENLMRLKKRTTIIVAHRLSTIKEADKIVVLDNPDSQGTRVIEYGTHAALMEIDNGIYRSLVLAQCENLGVLGSFQSMTGLNGTEGTVISAGAIPTTIDASVVARGGGYEVRLPDSVPRKSTSMGNSPVGISPYTPSPSSAVSPMGSSITEFKKSELITRMSQEMDTGAELTEDLVRGSAVSRMYRKYSLAETQLQCIDETTGTSAAKKAAVHVDTTTSKSRLEKLALTAAGASSMVTSQASRAIFHYLWPDMWIIVAGCVAASVTGVAWPLVSVMIAEFLGVFYDMDPDLTSAENAAHIQAQTNRLAVIFVIIAATLGIAFFSQSISFGYSGERMVKRVRDSVFRHLLYQDMEFFDAPHNNTGYLCAVLSADAATLRGVTGDNLSIIVQNTMTVISAFLIAFCTDWKLALVSIAAFGLVAPANLLQGRLLKVASVRPETILDPESSAFIMNETICSLRTVACYGIQDEMIRLYDKVLSRELKGGMNNAMITGLISGLATGILFAGNAASYYYGGMMVYEGTDNMDVTKMMRIIMVVMMAAQGMGRTTAWATDSKKAKVALRNVASIVSRKSAVDAKDETGLKEPFVADLKFENIKFRYPMRCEIPILDDVSFNAPDGETIALVGASGCGKSTIIQLLERFYLLSPSKYLELTVSKQQSATKLKPPVNPILLPHADSMYAGRILVGTEPMVNYNLKYWRSQIGLVSQEPVLFSTSIKENVRWGKIDATDDEIVEACRLANAHDFVQALPDGYDTEVGKGGALLSGGQKQRIAIARAIIRDPRILLLDEATSALDPESEEIVQKALDKLVNTKRRTTIIIAHRLSTIRDASKIIVFENEQDVGSKIVEEGNHESLMKLQGGVYRRLVEISQSAAKSGHQHRQA